MFWFQRRAQAESDRAALAAALQQLHLRLEQLEVGLADARAEAAARQDAWRALIERVGRTEVGLHTTGTQMANHSGVAVALDARISGLERRVSRDNQERLVALEQRLVGLEKRVAFRRDALPNLDHVLAPVTVRVAQLEEALGRTAVAADVVEARMTMIRVANEVARLDIELRSELAKAVNHVAALAGSLQPEPEPEPEPEAETPADYVYGRNGNTNGNGAAPAEIDLREEAAEVNL
jgi:chromosome segregation ATPase